MSAQLTEAQLAEIELYKRSMETIIQDEGLEAWDKLNNDKKREVLQKIKDLVECVSPQAERSFILGYTMRDGKIEVAAEFKKPAEEAETVAS